jgi:hypothetical protein
MLEASGKAGSKREASRDYHRPAARLRIRAAVVILHAVAGLFGVRR